MRIDDFRGILSHRANRGRWLRTLGRAVSWQIRTRLSRPYLDLTMFDGIKMRCHFDSSIAREMIYNNGLPDYDEMRFFQHYLRPGDAFLDVGANEGIYTLLAASRLGKSGSIDSFEPNPGPLARLRENIALNGLDAVRVHPVAVGAEPGTVRFMLDDQRSHIDAASEHGESAEVSMVRLDDELSGRRYAAGKMDIEGAEPLAMRGAERMLSEANPPVWLLEVQGHVARYGLSEEEFFDWLAAHGYDLATYDSEARRLCYLDRAPAKGAADRGRPANVLAIARASRPDVEARVRA